MLRFLAISLILFQTCGSLAQSDTINQRNLEDQKHGYWILHGSDRPTSGYPANGKIEEGPFTNDRKEGLWTKYWEDGITPKLRGTYKNNRPDGAYWKFHRNGKLKEQGEFRRGRYSGLHLKYNDEGKLLFRCLYNDEGRMIDTSFLYFQTGCIEAMEIMDSEGVLIRSTLYREDSCEQILKVVDHHAYETKKVTHRSQNQNDQSEFIYTVNPKNQEEGTWRYEEGYLKEYSDSSIYSSSSYTKKYNSRDEIIFEGRCKDGKVWEGKMYFYDSDMILLRIEVWGNGEFLKVGRL